MTLYINLGFPKTSTTNLQENFYPYLVGVNFIGRRSKTDKSYPKNYDQIFWNLSDFVENRLQFDDIKIEELKNQIRKLCKNKKILISQERWLVPYQKNYNTEKFEVVSQFKNLERLEGFLKKLQIDYKYFLIKRDSITSVKSMFATLQERIEKIFGPEYLDFDEFVKKYKRKDSDYESIRLFFDIYNLEKIKKIIPDEKLKIFNFSTIVDNPRMFLKEFSNYIDVEVDEFLVKKLNSKTRVSDKIDGKYAISKPKKFFIFLKKLVPSFIKNIVKSKINLNRDNNLFMKKDKLISIYSDEELRKIINYD